MSRNAPFPVVSNRRPQNPPDAGSYSNGIPVTQPLSISRPRPRSPGSDLSTSPASQGYNAPPIQPLRPARSERRPRQPPTVTGFDGVPPSTYSGPSSSGRPSFDAPQSNLYTNGAGRQSPMPSRYDQQQSKQQAPRPNLRDRADTFNTTSSRRTDDDPYGGMDYTQSPGPSSPGSGESPKALGSVIAAFQQAGTNARRKNTSGSEGLASDRDWERQRERERREKARQKTARPKNTGGIDGPSVHL